MPNYDDMDKQGKAGIGILTILLGGAVTAAVKHANNSSKREKLKQELNNVRYKLSPLKGNVFKEAWNYDEIQKLEAREAEILKQLKKL